MSNDLQSALIDIALWLYHGFLLPGDQFLSKFPELDVAGHGSSCGSCNLTPACRPQTC